MAKVSKYKFLFLFLIVFLPVKGQHKNSIFYLSDDDSIGTILPEVTKQVHLKYGNHYNVAIAVFDSMIGNIPISSFQEVINDPYSTLKGTVFFSATPEDYDPEDMDSTVIGFFKDGEIVWCSAPAFKGSPSQIYCTMDLNKDQEVDIITLWMPAYTYHAGASDIYVLSWNGTGCKVISDVSEFRESNLVTTGSSLQLIKNNNGIYDLQAYWSEAEDMKYYFPADPIPSRPWVIYSWNGKKYVQNYKFKK